MKKLNEDELLLVNGGKEYETHKYYILISYWKDRIGTTEDLGPYSTKEAALNAGLLCATIKYQEGYRHISYNYMYIGDNYRFLGDPKVYPTDGFEQ